VTESLLNLIKANGSNLENIPLYNSRIIDNYIRLIKKKYSEVDIGDLLKYADMKSYEIADQGHWFSQKQIDRFHERLSQVTHSSHISREAGRLSASPEAMGLIRQYVLALADPSQVYALIGRATEKVTRSITCESKMLDTNKVEIVVTPKQGVEEKPFQCENRIGTYESVTLAFTNKLPKIDHPECIFNGGKACRYILSWEKTFSAFFKKIRNYTAIVLFLLNLITAFIYPTFLFSTLIPISVVILISLAFITEHLEKRELKTSLSEEFSSTENLVDQINLTYDNALLAHEFGQAISKHTHIDDILANVVQILENRLDYDRGIILLANSDKTRLVFKAGFGYTDEEKRLLDQTQFHLDRPMSKGIFVISFQQQKSFLINDINTIAEDMSERSVQFLKSLGTQSFICCPIICDAESIGILAVDNLKSKQPLVQSDLSLLQGFAPVIGVSMRNATLLDTTMQQFHSIVHVMAASIDARDSLTAGHSEWVTQYALGICEELNLDPEYIEMIRIAALLHDYGKLAVPDEILKKPGLLTGKEQLIVQTHVEKTREILEKIHFEGIFKQIPEIAASHHEKIDGSGYPRGLKGDEIPLGAKIIGVADFFEAITAKRHYREPMATEAAIRLLKKERGEHFDEEIVDAFLRYYLNLTEEIRAAV